MTRSFDRANDQLRPVKMHPNYSRHAEGSCLIECGYTKVLCTASVDERVPPWLRDEKKGWVTGEYGMLPRSTDSRNPREAARGKQSGRTQEIQRLIGRSLRAVVDLKGLGERQVTLDCDVLEADGGTRTASITGAYVALALACHNLKDRGLITELPFIHSVAAISCGVVNGTPLLDLDYVEDSSAEVDANFILTGNGNIVEIQATGEERSFSDDEFDAMMKLAKKGIAELSKLQTKTIQEAA
ncbi:MAG: ribonuclease PH [Rickettsiales bacterium]|nr:ribonuclease PH [Rickettsiales bacterium]